MQKVWCISCKKEVENIDYERPCYSCGKDALTSIVPNSNDNERILIKQMIGEAQRKAERTGEKGEVEVSRTVLNSDGNYYCRILIYNTQTGNYRSN
ncbi:MAG: Hydrogenase maturation factor HybF [Mycoplasmataceae bacterium]|nr:MAG: Hydrogenase maturation factor HybF [Mycoplasmataceae bacterium]